MVEPIVNTGACFGYISAADFEEKESVDITEKFFKLCKTLPSGQLAMAQNFSLIDAMSAVELMDKKMDLGMTPIDQTLGLTYAIEKGHFNEKSFTSPEMIAIIDASFACISSSVDGAFFDQTIYTNICMHDPDAIKDYKLKTISKGLLTLTRTIRYLIDLAGIAFEEDYNYQCLRDQQQIKTDNLDLIKDLKNVYHQMVLSKPATGTSEHALAHRVKLLFSFFEALHYMVASPEVMSVESTLTFDVNFKESQTCMDQVLKAFEVVKTTISLGSQPPDNAGDGNYSWLSVFQPDVNRHLFGASFPKEAKIYSRNAGYEYLGKLLSYFHRFSYELPDNCKFIENLVSYVRNISVEGADVFSRSVLGLMIFPFNDHIFGKTPVSELIVNSMQAAVSPFITNKDYPFSEDIIDHWRLFLKEIATFFIDLIQALGMNLVRQREKLGHYMEDATNVYYKAEAMDRAIAEYMFTKPTHIEAMRKKPFPLSTFFASHFMELMSYYVELGFRLELFVDHELPYVYWYFGEVISLWRHRFWTKAKEYLEVERVLRPPAMPVKKWEKKKLQREMIINKNIVEVEKSMLEVRLQASFCDLYFYLSAGLVGSGNMIIPDNEQMRYSCRFEAFRHVPQFASYPYVKYVTDSNFSTYTAYPPAACFKKAVLAATTCVDVLEMLVQIFPNNSQLKDELNVAKRNRIACNLLTSKPEMYDSLDFKKNFLHPQIVVKNQSK